MNIVICLILAFYNNYRERVAMVTVDQSNMNSNQVTDTEILEFYNLATSKFLTGLEVST